MVDSNKYCDSLFSYSRLITREVRIGNLAIGANNPICIQSMTTTMTLDTKKTVQQAISLAEAGCEIIRITAPGIKEAENLRNIKREFRNAGFSNPLVADIHYTPNAALIAAEIVEKVRINPGNYIDKKNFSVQNYSDDEYNAELQRIYKKFSPLVLKCKKEGAAIRIGTNHGSLSDRIMNRYGDTPEGMVESAFEFVRICEDHNYHDIVLSMKSSNTRVVVQAYRLLVNKMLQNSFRYPLHLGVTEAGDGDDGRIKSAIGIGTLLEDGIGDTIRVSLTEDPEKEVPIAKKIAYRYNNRINERATSIKTTIPKNFSPFEYIKRTTCSIINIGAEKPPVVVADFKEVVDITEAKLFAVGYNYNHKNDSWHHADNAADYLLIKDQVIGFPLPGSLGIICNYYTWLQQLNSSYYPLLTAKEYQQEEKIHQKLNFVTCGLADLTTRMVDRIRKVSAVVLLCSEENIYSLRLFFFKLINHGITAPVVIMGKYKNVTYEDLLLNSSIDLGAVLIDGMGEGIILSNAKATGAIAANNIAFGILQASRTRISKTEYISCPSCGRTLFDLQETTAKIKAVTNHLKGVKIGIMGCIVNGPGEMADADYGYVGTGTGKITLYKGKTVMKRNIPEIEAVNNLILLIKENGDWQ